MIIISIPITSEQHLPHRKGAKFRPMAKYCHDVYAIHGKKSSLRCSHTLSLTGQMSPARAEPPEIG